MISASNKTSEPLRLQEKLRALSGKNLLLMITDNTRTMLSQQREGKILTVRMHRMFLSAPEKVLSALGWWIRGKRNDYEQIREFIDNNGDKIRAIDPQERKLTLLTSGKHHDLKEITERLNRDYLDGRSRAKITWGRKITNHRACRVRLGWYDPVRNLIAISRRLDTRDTPGYMVEYVVFHEMLHEILGIGERADGKRDIHGKTFKLMEQTYPFYEQARKFEHKKWGAGE